MVKPWDHINDRAMQLIMNELEDTYKEYKDTEKKLKFWSRAVFIPIFLLIFIFATRVHFDIYNIFSHIFDQKEVGFTIIVFIAISARIKILTIDEKDKKKDYKDVRGQVTDNLNYIWRYNYGMNTCNEIVNYLKNKGIDISYKG